MFCFVLFFQHIWSGSKLYYAFKAIHALKACIFSCAHHLSQSPGEKILLSIPQHPSLYKVTMFLNSRFWLANYFTIILLQWHWMLLVFSKREAMKMQGNPPGSNLHFTFSKELNSSSTCWRKKFSISSY